MENETMALMMAWRIWVDGLRVLQRRLRRRNRTPSSGLQISVSGDNNNVTVVQPGTGQHPHARISEWLAPSGSRRARQAGASAPSIGVGSERSTK